MRLVDTHCHIDNEKYDEDRKVILSDIRDNLEFAVNIGYDLESSKRSLKLAKENSFIYAVVGVHPVDFEVYSDEVEKNLEEMGKNPKVVAIGEMGLDYHWVKDDEGKMIQKVIFQKQLDLAKRLKKPVVIHTREATEDTIKILNLPENKEVKGIVHCYPGSFESAKLLMDRFYFGIGGVVTFKNSRKTVEAVKQIPLESIVIETDSPYLTPTPFRGKRNHPIYVEHIAKKIAEIKEVPLEEVVKVTTENAKKIYNIR